MTRAKRNADRPFETSEAKIVSLPFVIQNELHRASAEPAGPVVEKNRLVASYRGVSG